MQIENINSPASGGRVSSPKFRASLQKSEEFEGLKEEVSKFHALKLIKKAGKDAGFTSDLVELLEYYLVRTSDLDWAKGNKPICYQAVTTTAQDLDISERQVRNRENALNALGALTWCDSGNFKRFGMRDPATGQIAYAFGVDLSPLASLIPVLEQKIEKKKVLTALWNDQKRQISGLRARIRTLLAEACLYDVLEDFAETMQAEYEAISYSIRTYHSLTDLKTLYEKHQLVVSGLFDALNGVSKAEDNSSLSYDTSAMDEKNFPHIQRTTLLKSDKSDYSSPSDISLREGVAASIDLKRIDPAEGKSGGIVGASSTESLAGNISVKQVLNASSERFRSHIPLSGGRLDWSDLVEAAASLLPELKINKSAWWQACEVMDRYAAAICVMVIDQKSQDPENPIRNPGGYLREMTARAKKNELNLQNSVFGLLKRGDKGHDA